MPTVVTERVRQYRDRLKNRKVLITLSFDEDLLAEVIDIMKLSGQLDQNYDRREMETAFTHFIETLLMEKIE